MKIETMSVTGFEGAVYGMRLPMCKDLQDVMCKSDSSYEVPHYCDTRFIIGENDLKIAKNLIKADSNSSSQPNSKFLRMIHVQVAITAPLYWWKELDTYKIGTVANSTSTMHKLASTPITKDCFECGEWIPENTIKNLEGMRNCYNETKDKTVWKKLIVNLPESWLQTRMFDCDYATLRNIYTWRKHHKLTEWHTFCDWIKSLPYADDFICGAELGKANEYHEIESKVSPKREISKQYMPKNKEKVLLKYHFRGDDEIHISDGYYDAYDSEFHITNNPISRIVCVIAWKEIVLPEPLKETE